MILILDKSINTNAYNICQYIIVSDAVKLVECGLKNLMRIPNLHAFTTSQKSVLMLRRLLVIITHVKPMEN